ncbi:MAG: glutamate racemase [Oscillospiraceae bacterium]|nr:glutamate racemase [Oscillospiraceae bacterium]
MTHTPKNPIGIYDSGVGGLTVLRELRARLPGEDILYFGDSINCPFGNRNEEELQAITSRIFTFFASRGVKLTVSACNTTSALFQLKSEPDFGFPILGIIVPIAVRIARLGLGEIGLIGTEFTVSSGIYERQLKNFAPEMQVWGQGSRNLARLVDQCRFDGDEIPNEVEKCTGALFAQKKLDHVILACTHYPIVRDTFCKAAPGVTFLDPAKEQAVSAEKLLSEQGLKNPQASGKLEVYTSGDPALFERVAEKIGLGGEFKAERMVL